MSTDDVSDWFLAQRRLHLHLCKQLIDNVRFLQMPIMIYRHYSAMSENAGQTPKKSDPVVHEEHAPLHVVRQAYRKREVPRLAMSQ